MHHTVDMDFCFQFGAVYAPQSKLYVFFKTPPASSGKVIWVSGDFFRETASYTLAAQGCDIRQNLRAHRYAFQPRQVRL